MKASPPLWADRFLRWYCNPELLEEIQGDAQELYFERLKRDGKRSADIKYIRDVFRFFRWSNIRREQAYMPGSLGRWQLNFKMSVRHAQRNKLIFAIKTFGLSICLAFVLLLTGFIVNEVTFDEFNPNHDRIYRTSLIVNFRDHVTHYAMAPLPMGETLKREIPEIENYTRFMLEDQIILRVNDNIVDEVVFAADSNFLKLFALNVIVGNERALSEPDKIVLTKSVAAKFFGVEDPIGKDIEFGDESYLEVAAVIQDPPANSHLQFDVLVSWDTFQRNESWSNLNAYTYILLKPDATIDRVRRTTVTVMEAYGELITREYEGGVDTAFEKITDIHFSEHLEEDIAQKRSRSSVLILIAVVVLFLITGLINYLNLALAELTANSKKIGIIKVFGGLAEGHRKILVTEIGLTLLVVIPLAAMVAFAGWRIAGDYSISISPQAFLNPVVIVLMTGFVGVLILSSLLNAHVLARTSHLFNSLKGKMRNGLPIRRILVSVQLSFSMIMIALIVVVVDQFNFIQETDKGYEDRNIIVMRLRNSEYQDVEVFREKLRKIAGIEKIGISSYAPGVIETKYVFNVETENGMQQHLVPMMRCSYEFLDLLGIRIVKGRGFSVEHSTDQQRAFIVNEGAAKAFGWRNGNGKKIEGPVDGEGVSYREGEVIGVARNFNFASLYESIEPMIIFPADDYWPNEFLYLKVNPVRMAALVPAIENEFQSQWPDLPFEWDHLDAKYLNLYEKDTELKNIFEVGLMISIVTSAMGIFSISALLASVRSKEMGIRKVSGASPFELFAIHTRTFLQFVVFAAVVSAPAIWYISGTWLQNFAYHVSLGAKHFIWPCVITAVILLVTSFYHGMKSAMVNPVDTLRHE